MSITFDVSSFEVETRACAVCEQCSFKQDGQGITCMCDGTTEVCLTPSVNLANVNARALLSMLGISPEDYGHIEAESLPAVQRQLVRLMNQGSARAPFVMEAYQDGRMIDCGRTDNRILRQLEHFQELVSYAQEHNESIVWG